MIAHIRTRAVWLAIGLLFGGSAFAFAGATKVGVSDTSSKKPAVTSTEDADVEEPEVEETEEPEAEQTESADEASGERKRNHGFYVSSAAHCEDVNDTENDVAFSAPADCADNGKSHGEYVKSVAQSDAGKKDKGADDETAGS